MSRLRVTFLIILLYLVIPTPGLIIYTLLQWRKGQLNLQAFRSLLPFVYVYFALAGAGLILAYLQERMRKARRRCGKERRFYEAIEGIALVVVFCAVIAFFEGIYGILDSAKTAWLCVGALIYIFCHRSSFWQEGVEKGSVE